MNSPATLAKSPRQKTMGTSAERETEFNAPEGGESRDKSQRWELHFQGGGILLRPITFYVRNDEPTLREFEIF